MREAKKIELIERLCIHLGKGSFRWLIYDQLGLSNKAYLPLYYAGLMRINNLMLDDREKRTKEILNE